MTDVQYAVRFIGLHSARKRTCASCGMTMAPLDPFVKVEVDLAPGHLLNSQGARMFPATRTLVAGRVCSRRCAEMIERAIPRALAVLADRLAEYPPIGGDEGFIEPV